MRKKYSSLKSAYVKVFFGIRHKNRKSFTLFQSAFYIPDIRPAKKSHANIASELISEIQHAVPYVTISVTKEKYDIFYNVWSEF